MTLYGWDFRDDCPKLILSVSLGTWFPVAVNWFPISVRSWNKQLKEYTWDNTGSRSTFEFPSRVNLSGPSLYCSTDRTSRCNKVDVVRLYASYRLNLLSLKGQSYVREEFIQPWDLCALRVSSHLYSFILCW